jgi:hypothetical protein
MQLFTAGSDLFNCQSKSGTLFLKSFFLGVQLSPQIGYFRLQCPFLLICKQRGLLQLRYCGL